jgi:cytoskeletal protein RodZ
MKQPDRLAQLTAAHRRIRRPDPRLRDVVADAVERDRRREQRRRWIDRSFVAVAVGAAALWLVQWIAAPTRAQNHPTERGQAVYGEREQPGSSAARAEPETLSVTQPASSGPEAAPSVATPGQPTPIAVPKSPPREPEAIPGTREGRTPHTRAHGPSATDDGAREVRALREAEVALGRDASEALRRLNRHVQEFPTSTLGVEREALFILALCETGAVEAARARRTAFLAEHRDSAYAPRLRAACGP